MNQITNAPLPKWQHLLKALFYRKELDEEFFRDWSGEQNECFLFSRSAWALYFIAVCRKELKHKETLVIWIPDYFCNATLAPLRELKATLVFYKIQSDGNPDLSACKNLLENNPNPDIVLASHYFGRMMNLKEFFDYFRSKGSWLVEDAAHMLAPQKDIGEFSDFTFYSPHKFLAIPDGAILQVKKNSKSFNPLDIDLIKQSYSDFMSKSRSNNFSSYFWLFKRFIQKIGIRRNFVLRDLDKDELVLSSKKFLNPKISTISKILLSLQEGYHQELLIRKANYKAWLILLDSLGIDGKEVFPESINISPYMFGLSFDDNLAYKRALKILIEKKIPISTWPDLPPEVINSEEVYRESIQLRLNSLFFPIHNSLNKSVIETF